MNFSAPLASTSKVPVLVTESGVAAWPTTSNSARILIVPAFLVGLMPAVLIWRLLWISSVASDSTIKLSITMLVEQETVYATPRLGMMTSSNGIGTAPVLQPVGSSQFPPIGMGLPWAFNMGLPRRSVSTFVQMTGPEGSTAVVNSKVAVEYGLPTAPGLGGLTLAVMVSVPLWPGCSISHKPFCIKSLAGIVTTVWPFLLTTR